ncbi:MAG: hypothetical protein K8T20_07495 [Planctomycetes bacterium]|nr:hypothetical protein [Planctomycetota bacterium]
MSKSYEEELSLAEGRVAASRAAGPASEGRELAALARVHVAGRQYEKAQAVLGEAEARLHPAGQATDAAGKRAWLVLRATIADARGRLESATGKTGHAADLFQESAHLAKEAGETALRADALLSLAVANAHLGKVLDAAILAEEAEDLFVESGSGTGDVASRAVADRMAAAIAENEDLSEAADEDLAEARLPGKDPRQLGWRLRSAAASFSAGDDDESVNEAIELLQDAGAAFREADSRSGEARAIRSEAACFARIGQLDEALEAFLEAAAIYAEINAPLPHGRALLEAGHAARAAEEVRKAEECYNEAAKLFATHGARFEEAFVTEARSDLRLESGKAAEARAGYEQAVGIYGELGASVDDQRAGCLMSLGLACREMGEMDEASKQLTIAQEMFEAMGEEEMVAECAKELKKTGKRKK